MVPPPLLPATSGVLPGSPNPIEKVSQAEYSADELFAQLGASNSMPYVFKKANTDPTIIKIFAVRMKFIIGRLV